MTVEEARLKESLRRLNTEGVIRTDIENLLLKEMVISDRAQILEEDFIDDSIVFRDETNGDLFDTIGPAEDREWEKTVPDDVVTPDNLF